MNNEPVLNTPESLMQNAASPAPIESALLKQAADDAIIHGYFTRQGGVSEGLYRGLNVGLGSNDNRDHDRWTW